MLNKIIDIRFISLSDIAKRLTKEKKKELSKFNSGKEKDGEIWLDLAKEETRLKKEILDILGVTYDE